MTTCMLSVNLNAVAHLRNRRDVGWPNVADYGQKVLRAGAKGLTIHPRPDERHIRHSDVSALKALFLQDEYAACEYNIEGYPDARFMTLVRENTPHQVTLVPDSPEQSTSDHGWDFASSSDMLKDIVSQIKQMGSRAALFIDATPESAEAAAKTGADRVEIYTGPFGACTDGASAKLEARKIIATINTARANGLDVNAGHDLTLENMPILASLGAQIDEVSIGHGFWSDAWLYGIELTTQKYIQAAQGLSG